MHYYVENLNDCLIILGKTEFPHRLEIKSCQTGAAQPGLSLARALGQNTIVGWAGQPNCLLGYVFCSLGQPQTLG